MTLEESRTLVEYSRWARNRILDAVATIPGEQFTRSLGNSFGSIRDTIVHMLWAEMIWLSRWRGEATAAKSSAESFPDVASIRKAWGEHDAGLDEYLKGVDEKRLQASISYKGLNGMPYETPLWQMLQHVVNHGTYHRGQVTTMLRQLGAAPPKGTDLILYYREM